MDTTEQLLLLGLGTIALLLLGLPLHRHREEALSRMAGVMWLLSTGVMIWFLGLLFSDVVRIDGNHVAFAVGIGSGILAGVLVALRPGALQQIALYAGCLITATGFAVAFGPEFLSSSSDGPTWLGPSVYVLGLVWFGAIALRVLRPTGTALVLGSTSLLAGPWVWGLEEVAAAPFVGLVTAVSLLGGSVRLRRPVLLVCGGVGVFGYLYWSVGEYLGSGGRLDFGLAAA